MSCSNNVNILKSCDYVTLDVKNTDAWKNATVDTDTIGIMEWFIPNGAYKSVIETPHVTTVELVNAAFNGGPKAVVMKYHNGSMNHFTHSRGAPLIAYGNVRASSSTVLLSSGEMIVHDSPNFIKISIEDVDGAAITKHGLIGLIFTLKYSYYESTTRSGERAII